jgi:pimeloyl-ACP methyl ester carboxylesterase
MPSQTWLIEGSVRLLTVQHFPEMVLPIGAAVLLSGFSHPMCDLDYLMSRLARKLAAQGLRAAQVDLRGHGDSTGRLEDVDLDTLREDINTVAAHFARMFPDQLFFIARGLSGTLLTEQLAARPNIAVAGISLFELPPQLMRSHLESTARPGETLDTCDLFPGRDYVQLSDFAGSSIAIIDALGTVPYHLHGASISARLARQLAQFDAGAVLRRGRESGLLFHEAQFLREAAFQARLVERLSSVIVERCIMG